VTEGMGVLSSN